MNPYVELARPGNAVMASFGALLGMLVVLGPDLWDPDLLVPVVIGVLVPFLVTAGGNSLNDYMDHLVDQEAHPERPLPSGRLTTTQVMGFGMICFFVGAAMAATIVTLTDIGLLPALLALLAIMSLYAYELAFKYRGFIGNLMVAFLSALTFIFGASVVAEPDHEGWLTVIVLSLLAFFASLGREITKDIEDMEADRGSRRTYPMEVGTGTASIVAGGYICIAVVLSPTPFWPLDTMGWPYLAVVLVSVAFFLYSLVLLRREPGRAQHLHKYGMVIALLAFLVGSLAGGIT
jgi:geranylgeranylglycerol-phosphate geranylgeranyltransferase